MSRRGWIVLGVIAGLIIVSVAVWAFIMFGPPRKSEVVSKPEFCARCHEMDPQYTRFKEGTHGDLESCNECHLPNRTFAGHWFWDSVVGARDLVLHTIGAVPSQKEMDATDQSRGWIQTNCLACHEDDIEADHGEEEPYCWNCHDDIYHAEESGAGNRRAPPPPEDEETPVYFAASPH